MFRTRSLEIQIVHVSYHTFVRSKFHSIQDVKTTYPKSIYVKTLCYKNKGFSFTRWKINLALLSDFEMRFSSGQFFLSKAVILYYGMHYGINAIISNVEVIAFSVKSVICLVSHTFPGTKVKTVDIDSLFHIPPSFLKNLSINLWIFLFIQVQLKRCAMIE